MPRWPLLIRFIVATMEERGKSSTELSDSAGALALHWKMTQQQAQNRFHKTDLSTQVLTTGTGIVEKRCNTNRLANLYWYKGKKEDAALLYSTTPTHF